MSVQMNEGERLVICMGQDEAIFKQYIFPNEVWKYNGYHRLIPKDEGCGIMISEFQSREFGYSYPPITSEPINTFNDYFRRNNQYTDTIAPTKILNRTNKQPITPQESPFDKSLKCGSHYRSILDL